MELKEDDDISPDMEGTIREALAKMGPLEDKSVEPDEAKYESSESSEKTESAPAAAEVPVKRRAPDTWKKEAAAKWDAIDPDIQTEVERRENDMRTGLETYGSKAKRADSYEKAFQPFMATIQSLGVSPEGAVSALMSTDHSLRYGTQEQKLEKFRQIAKDYGVDVGRLQGEAQQGQPVDSQYASLEQRHTQMENYLRQQQAQSQQNEMTRVTSEIDSFKKGHPHLEIVREDMAALLQANRAKGLDDAYEMATWAKPELRAGLLAEQQERIRTETANKAAEARKASAVNIPAKGRIASAEPVGLMEDTIRAGLKRLGQLN